MCSGVSTRQEGKYKPLLLNVGTQMHGLERALVLRSTTNAYFSPPYARGLETHWDLTDVFVLQVQGQRVCVVETHSSSPADAPFLLCAGGWHQAVACVPNPWHHYPHRLSQRRRAGAAKPALHERYHVPRQVRCAGFGAFPDWLVLTCSVQCLVHASRHGTHASHGRVRVAAPDTGHGH